MRGDSVPAIPGGSRQLLLVSTARAHSLAVTATDGSRARPVTASQDPRLLQAESRFRSVSVRLACAGISWSVVHHDHPRGVLVGNSRKPSAIRESRHIWATTRACVASATR